MKVHSASKGSLVFSDYEFAAYLLMDTVMDLNKAIQEMSIADDKPLVRGVALSQERFQFIFKSEDDLFEILKT